MNPPPPSLPTPRRPDGRAPLLALLLLLVAILTTPARGELSLHTTQLSPSIAPTRVPATTAQGRTLAPQAISAVDISADGQHITVGTMAFSHDANVWLLAPDGTVSASRHFPPFAPMQVATLNGGRALAVGLAYSRVTSPEPTTWLGPTNAFFGATLKDELAEADTRDSELARLRPGTGDWRTGWLASHLGELFLRGPDWIFKPSSSFLHADGRRQHLRYEDKNQLPTNRATRMAASGDGKRAAFGWLTFNQPAPGSRPQRDAVSVWGVNPNRPLWTAPASDDLVAPDLPDPAADFPALLKDGFRLRADTIAPGTVTAAVAVNADGSRVAILEYAVKIWVRSGPAIGKWDPPIHALNFVPQQRGRLRVFNAEGRELLRETLPEAGLFELGFSNDADTVWCSPASWFARGMAGEPWLPIDPAPRTVYRVALKNRTADALIFPDAVAQCVPNPAHPQALVSCWDGHLYLLNADGKITANHDVAAAARLAWSGDGAFAIAGTAEGKLLRLARDGTLAWQQRLLPAEPPVITTPPAEIVTGVPIFQGGRIPRSEHAYVGDIWIIKTGREAVIVDAGGTSGFASSQARLRALGIERATHVLHTHSHGDHAGGAYLWRAEGAKIVAPKSGALPLTWLMPMLTDYGIFPPRPLDLPLPLARVGDETDFEVSGQKFRALFVPGHSFDLTVYKTELAGKRIAFTGDLGFERTGEILDRCWGDAAKARPVIAAIREKLLAWQPDLVFTGHGVRPTGTAWVEDLLRRSEESLAKAGAAERKP